MPNWVYNGLTIEGNPDQINKLVEQMNKPFYQDVEAFGDTEFKLKRVMYDNPVFAFWNIIAPTNLEAYSGQPVRSDKDVNDPNWWSDLQEKSKTDDSWYNWNIRNWGVKWDVAVANDNKYPDTYMEGPTENGENLVVYYNFHTPWGVADQALIKLSEQYPDLLFTLSFEEETGWGGEAEFLGGENISLSEYETMCKNCDETDCVEYCDECQIDVCSACHNLDEADPNDVESCDKHRALLKENA
jgi:hypothetical protein